MVPAFEFLSYDELLIVALGGLALVLMNAGHFARHALAPRSTAPAATLPSLARVSRPAIVPVAVGTGVRPAEPIVPRLRRRVEARAARRGHRLLPRHARH